ncbi:MAG TPA: hypothetical protein VFH61_04860, partial [Thermoleophilia bacterium]|nr:hypothetical protein [Thermoleophilia bacterium]
MVGDWLGDNAISIVGALVAVAAVLVALRSARAAERSATVASAQLHPLLVDVPYEYYTDYEHEVPLPTGEIRKSAMRGEIMANFSEGWLTVPVRNVGRGPAVIEEVEVRLFAPDDTIAAPVPEAMTTSVVAPGEETWIGIRVDASQNEHFTRAGHQQGGISLVVVYADYLRGRRERATFDLGSRGRS